ncbi:hypothetical protein C8J57DRAFT_1731305, partial [Mycena rebaudengoi]
MSGSRLQALLDSTDLDYATFTSDYRIYRYVFLAGLVIVIYDHLLTFSKEVKYIWLTKLRPSTCWFLAARYIGLIGNIIVSVFYFGALSHEEVLIETTLSIRVFAMYGRNMWVLVPLPALVCISGILAVIWQGLGWSCPLACDVLVFALTVRQAYVQRHTSRLYAGLLIQRMLKDGSMYFGVIVLATIANISTFHLGDIDPPFQIITKLTLHVIPSLSLTLLCRLMLNLHEAGAGRIDTLELNTLDLASIQFAATMMGTTVDEEY